MSFPKMTDPPPTQAKPICDLMVEIGVYQDSAIPSEVRIAELALQELLTQHGRLLWALIHDRLGPVDQDSLGSLNYDRDEIFNQLAHRIWKYSTSFEPKGSDPDELRKQFTGWAATMLRNLVIDIHRAIEMERDQIDYLEGIWEGFLSEETEESERVRIVREVLAEMSPEDAEVLRWSAPLIPLDGTSMQPDPLERDAICQQLGVTPEGLRQRRSRALKKLKAALELRFES